MSRFPETRLLRRALLANSVFSGASGVLLTILSWWLAPVMLKADAALWGIRGWILILVAGALLLPFAAGLYKLAKAATLSPVGPKAIIAMDIAWVIFSLVVLSAFEGVLTAAGCWIVAVQAAIVAVIAILQTAGLVQMRELAAAE